MKKGNIFYLDDENNITERAKATHFRGIEYDENGNRINEVYGVININEVNSDLEIEYTDEEREFLNNFVDKHGNHPFRK